MTDINHVFVDIEHSKLPSVPLEITEHLPPVPLETLREQLPPNFLTMKIQDYIVGFSGQISSYCVGIVDMVDSTIISSKLSLQKSAKYYEIFLNTMARVLNRFGGMIVKNGGDSLLFYFPESSKGRRYGFMTCLEGCLAMTDAHDFVNMCAKKENLPPINYRISCDYGPIMIMDKNESHGMDMIGPSLNMCSKINHFASKNEFVIGGDLYESVKKLPDYEFTSKGAFDTGLKSDYSIYTITRK